MKNTLFRFTTTRNFQRISEDNKSSYYVEASNSIKNQLYFLEGLTPGVTYYQLIKIIRDKESSFVGEKRISELRSYKRGIIYDVSLILRSRMNFESLIESLNDKIDLNDKGYYTLSEEEEISLWDNLIYRLLIKKSKTDVDAIISLLIANNFLNKFDQGINIFGSLNVERKKNIERLSSSKLVLPLDIRLPETNRWQNNVLSSQQKEVLLEKQNLIITRSQVEDLKQLNQDVKELIAQKDFLVNPRSLFPSNEIVIKENGSGYEGTTFNVDWADPNRPLAGFYKEIQDELKDLEKLESSNVEYSPSGIDETNSSVEQPWDSTSDVIGPRPDESEINPVDVGRPEIDSDENNPLMEQPRELAPDVNAPRTDGVYINPVDIGRTTVNLNEDYSSMEQPPELTSKISDQRIDGFDTNQGYICNSTVNSGELYSNIEQSPKPFNSNNSGQDQVDISLDQAHHYKSVQAEPSPNTGENSVKTTYGNENNNETISSNLTYKSKKTLNKLNHSYKSLRKLEAHVANDINLKLKTTYSRLKFRSTRAMVNGVRLNIKIVPIDNSFVISTRHSGQSHFDIYLTQYFINSDNAIAEIEGEIILGDGGSKLQLAGTEILHSFSNYVTFKLNEEAIDNISNKVQVDKLNLKYRTRRDLFTDIEEVIDRIRLIYPHYGVLKVAPGRVLPVRPPLYGVTDLGIIDFRRVEQEVLCYEPGEVSHIENILASEYKEKTSRSFVSTEITEESENISESEQITDSSSTERLEMQSEISEVLSAENSKEFALGAGVSGSSFGVTFNVDSDISFSSSNSKEKSNRVAISRAKEITSQVKERILTKITRKRSYKLLREYEETNKHGFDNRLNNKHVVGIYRWIDKIIQNELVNYGTRLTYQFFIGEPARNFKESLVIQSQGSSPVVSSRAITMLAFEKLQNPVEFLGNNGRDLTVEELYIVAPKYGVKLDRLPGPVQYVSRSFAMVMRESGEDWKTDDARAYNDEFLIPENYYCEEVKIRAVAGVHGDVEGDHWATVIIGDKEIPVLTYTGVEIAGISINTNAHLKIDITEVIPRTEGSLAVSYIANDIGTLSFNVLAKCQLKIGVINKWKSDAFHAMILAYEKKLQEYEDKMQSINVASNEPEGPETRDHNYNPLINRRIEQTELKRLCIEMMTQTFDGEFILSADSYKPEETTLNLNQDYDTRAKRINFLEDAFDWGLMAYKFFPYFYAQKGDWHEMMHVDGTTDEVFKSFLSSGMAKVKLPVKRGYENAVQFFLRTGEVWFGSGFVLDSEDDVDISINEEIDSGQEEFKIEETWLTRLPTTLTIVQDKGNSLFGEGLPCRNSEDNLAKGESLLQGIEKKKIEG